MHLYRLVDSNSSDIEMTSINEKAVAPRTARFGEDATAHNEVGGEHVEAGGEHVEAGEAASTLAPSGTREKGSDYAQSLSGTTHKHEFSRAERKLLWKLGEWRQAAYLF